MENIYLKVFVIIQVSLKMVKQMEKDFNMIRMVFYYMKEILLMIKETETENYFKKIVLILQVDLKIEKDMEMEKNMIKMGN